MISFKKLLFILLIIIFCIEGIGRVYDYYKPKKNSAEIVKFSQEGVVSYQGFDYAVKKPLNTYRVFVFGGSAAQGFGNDYTKSWAYLLEEALQKTLAPQKNVEVINFATASFTSVDDYVNFVKSGKQLDPDLVLVYNGWNDILAFLNNPGWMIYHTAEELANINQKWKIYDLKLKLRHSFFVVRKFLRVKRKFENRVSEFYAFLNKTRYSIYAFLGDFLNFPRNEFEEYFKPSNQIQDRGKYLEKMLKERDVQVSYLEHYDTFKEDLQNLYASYYHQNMESLAGELKDFGVPAYFIFQPDLSFYGMKRALSEKEEEIILSPLGAKTKIWKKAVRDFYPLGMKIMEEIALKYDIRYVNMQNLIEKYPGEIVFGDTVHYTEEGNRIISYEFLQQMIKDNPFLFTNSEKIDIGSAARAV